MHLLDGEDKPRFHGTGTKTSTRRLVTEWLMNPILPLFGEPSKDLLDIFGQVNGSTTVYRFWPGNPLLPVDSRSTEHGHQNDTPANYSSLVYYYFLPE
jgi:hypothetical protein